MKNKEIRLNNLPCPFCGESGLRNFSYDLLYYYACDMCDSTGPLADSEEEALKLWNERYKDE